MGVWGRDRRPLRHGSVRPATTRPGNGCWTQTTARWWEGRKVRGYSMDKDTYLARLRKIEGQVRGLERMVDEDAYCIDVLT